MPNCTKWPNCAKLPNLGGEVVRCLPGQGAGLEHHLGPLARARSVSLVDDELTVFLLDRRIPQAALPAGLRRHDAEPGTPRARRVGVGQQVRTVSRVLVTNRFRNEILSHPMAPNPSAPRTPPTRVAVPGYPGQCAIRPQSRRVLETSAGATPHRHGGWT